jgi:RNA polymerase Rpb2, domain 6/RNA polymerase Rpb1, domain 2/RNA polymerase Rpb2, domain 3
MSAQTSAPWHQQSFIKFLNHDLPNLLRNRIPLSDYSAKTDDQYSSTIEVTLTAGKLQLREVYPKLPYPDLDGCFLLDQRRYVVVPIANEDDLTVAEIRCVGELLLDFIDSRLEDAPQDQHWDAALLKRWLPLNAWIEEFMQTLAQPLDETNPLTARVHPRRLLIPSSRRLIGPGHLGRVCPFETPQGGNLGQALTVADGAEIRDGRVQIVKNDAASMLGITALMTPFIECNAPRRQLIACNVMRQWQVPRIAEPALVQTGMEFDDPHFWCGVNLLTAFVAGGSDSFKDGIILSQSAAQRFQFETDLSVGDKISNRHGQKGIVSCVLPDNQMPRLGDGTVVDLIVTFIDCHRRKNLGQLREAVMGRLAKARGEFVTVSPFQAPDETQMRKLLREEGLPETGMENLIDSRTDKPYPRPSTVGWVYWGRTVHEARKKLTATTNPMDNGTAQLQGVLEHAALIESKALENINEYVNIRACENPDAPKLAVTLATESLKSVNTPAPRFVVLKRRLAALGIEIEVSNQALRFRLREPSGETRNLFTSVPHPWGLGQIDVVGKVADIDAWDLVVHADDQMRKYSANTTPERIQSRLKRRLEEMIEIYFNKVIHPGLLRFASRSYFTGRAMIAPANASIGLEQVGLPEEIAWTLFGSLCEKELGSPVAVKDRTPDAEVVLDKVMSDSWVLLNHAPSLQATNIIALRPVRQAEPVLRIHPLTAPLFDADFDGDQMVITLPITEAAQVEARIRLSLTGHLSRDPALLSQLCPTGEAIWGLSELSRTAMGYEKLTELLGIQIDKPDGYVTRSTLTKALKEVLVKNGIPTLITKLELLTNLGFESAMCSGASISPFAGAEIKLPSRDSGPMPADDAQRTAELTAILTEQTEFDEPDLGPQLLAVRCGAAGDWSDLRQLVTVAPEGYSSLEMRENASLTRERMRSSLLSVEELAERRRRIALPETYGVIARALRSDIPGIVFARAAAAEEQDPLTDSRCRLFVGFHQENK